MQLQIHTRHIHAWRIEEEFENTPHLHENQFQITIPLYGKCHFTHEHSGYELTAGQCLVQHPQDRHSFRLGPESGVMILQVERDGMNRLSSRGETELAFRQSIDPAQAVAGFREWYGALFSQDRFDRLAEEETEARVLFFLFRHLRGSHADEGPRSPIWSDAAAEEPHLARAIAHIRAHYAEPLGIDELAAIAMQSRYHFIRSFKAFTGMSPYQYVLKLRIEHAKERLLASSLSVTEIALESGFSGASQFYRAFGKAVGMAPERFRSGGPAKF